MSRDTIGFGRIRDDSVAGPTITSLDPAAFGGWAIAFFVIFALIVVSAVAAFVLAWRGLHSFYGWGAGRALGDRRA